MKMAENRIRPARVTNEPTDVRSFPSVAFNTLAICRLCEFEIELLAISASLASCVSDVYSGIDIARTLIGYFK
jgi:hypothetical protein